MVRLWNGSGTCRCKMAGLRRVQELVEWEPLPYLGSGSFCLSSGSVLRARWILCEPDRGCVGSGWEVAHACPPCAISSPGLCVASTAACYPSGYMAAPGGRRCAPQES